MRRREFVTLLGGALAAFPASVAAQQAGRVYRIGFLGGADPIGYAVNMNALRLGLRDHGYIEGKNITIDERWAEGRYDRLPALASELVGVLKVDIIITQGTPAALAAKQATTTIPIVMAIVGNPVDTGIVASLARPGGNITGSSFFWAELNAKRLELMKEVMPALARAGVLSNPGNAAMAPLLRAMQQRAGAINVEFRSVNAPSVEKLDDALRLAKTQVEALVVVEDGMFFANARRIAELATANRLPSIGFREYCEAGGMVAYGVDFPYIWRQSMVLVDKILKGANPADIPIQQATRFEFIVNLRTAKLLGVDVPSTLSTRVDQVIR